MPDIHSLDGLVDRLKMVSVDNMAATALALLAEPIDWVGLVRNHLGALTESTFLRQTRQILIEGVEPKTFLLHDEPGKFSIVLNHFDRESFACHRVEGRITPHFHRSDFATRILAGRYHHLLFDNAGEQTRPQLSLWHQTHDDVDHVYLLPWQEYHCVLAPDQDTMSLQIRGPARFQHSIEIARTSDAELLRTRDAALSTLDRAGSDSALRGHLPEFAQRWIPNLDELTSTSVVS